MRMHLSGDFLINSCGRAALVYLDVEAPVRACMVSAMLGRSYKELLAIIGGEYLAEVGHLADSCLHPDARRGTGEQQPEGKSPGVCDMFGLMVDSCVQACHLGISISLGCPILLNWRCEPA